MQQTENLKLNKIELTDSVDITVINPNWECIDNEITKIKNNKVDKVNDKGLSTNDFTTAEKTKLEGITPNATKTEASTTNGKIKINGTETTVYTHPSGTNPHGTTKADVGLGNVDNTSDLNKPISNATQKALDGKADKTHVSDEIIHITASERTTWNGKANASHTHTNYAPNGYGLGGSCAIPTGNDWDNALKTGFYMGTNQANAPNTDWWMGYVLNHHDGWIVQKVCNFNSSQQWMTRYKLNGTWTAWTNEYDRKIVHSTANPSGGLNGDVWIQYS